MLNFSTKELAKSNPKHAIETKKNEIKDPKTLKKFEQKTNFSKKISKEDTYEDSSKNLANFFNGQIIEVDE